MVVALGFLVCALAVVPSGIAKPRDGIPAWVEASSTRTLARLFGNPSVTETWNIPSARKIVVVWEFQWITVLPSVLGILERGAAARQSGAREFRPTHAPPDRRAAVLRGTWNQAASERLPRSLSQVAGRSTAVGQLKTARRLAFHSPRRTFGGLADVPSGDHAAPFAARRSDGVRRGRRGRRCRGGCAPAAERTGAADCEQLPVAVRGNVTKQLPERPRASAPARAARLSTACVRS